MKIKSMLLLLFLTVFLFSSCSVFFPPVPIILSPKNCSTVFLEEICLCWLSTRSDVVFDVYFGSDPDDLKLIEKNITKDKCFLSGNLEKNRYYYWKVVSKFTSGSYSSSDINCFHLRGEI